jgi:hypothetical protein
MCSLTTGSDSIRFVGRSGLEVALHSANLRVRKHHQGYLLVLVEQSDIHLAQPRKRYLVNWI